MAYHFQTQPPEKSSHLEVKTITKMRTFSGDWVRNWYAIAAVYLTENIF